MQRASKIPQQAPNESNGLYFCRLANCGFLQEAAHFALEHRIPLIQGPTCSCRWCSISELQRKMVLSMLHKQE